MTLRDVTQPLRIIPPRKRREKYAKTFFGAFIFLGGFFLPAFLPFPWQVGAVVSAFGAFTMSQELVTAFLKTLINAVKLFRNGKADRS